MRAIIVTSESNSDGMATAYEVSVPLPDVDWPMFSPDTISLARTKPTTSKR